MSLRRLLYLIPVGVSAATAVLAVLCLLAGLQEIERNFIGFFFHANGTVASMQRGDWEGYAVGVRPGDVVISAQGQPLSNGEELNRVIGRMSIGSRISLELKRPSTGRHLQVELLVRQLTTADVLATFVLPYSIGVIYLLIGAMVFFVKRTYGAALAMSISVVASVFYLTIFDAHTAFSFSRLWVAYPLLGAVSVHLFSVFPAQRHRVHRLVILLIPYAAAAAILVVTQWTLRDARFAAASSVISSSYLAICFMIDIMLLTSTIRTDPSDSTRNKAKTIRIGLLLTVAAGVVWSLLVRIHPELITAELAMMLSALFPILLAYAVIKKDLFDLDIVLRTTTTYVVATALVIALYFAVVSVLVLAMGPWTRRYFGLQRVELAAVLSTLIVALLFHPLRVGVQRVVNRFFFREKVMRQEAMARLIKELSSLTTELPMLADRLTRRARDVLRCRYAALLCPGIHSQVFQMVSVAGEADPHLAALSLPRDAALTRFIADSAEPLTAWPAQDHGDLLHDAEISLVIPLCRGPSLTGILLLGPRHHGDVFTSFDVGLVRSLAPSVSLILENALLLREHAERERLAALGRLSTVIIHEIKNPLGIIRVSSGTLKKRFEASDSGFELASFIEEEVVRMNDTIAQFLTFARPQQPKPAPFCLTELVQRMASAARADLEQAEIELVTELDEDVHALADADQVQQVLLNLLVNARQALEGRQDGQVRLILRGNSVRPPELIIADNGPGIDPTDQKRIFEPFYSTRSGGTGLGLAIARQLLGEQGGRIRVRSGKKGTEFIVYLPPVSSE